MNQYNKIKKLLPTLTVTLTLMISFATPNVFADDNPKNDFITTTTENIQNDPILTKILENIEKSKKDFSDLQQKTNQEKYIDEQRGIAKNILEQELEQMFKNNEDFTPLSAFKNFLKKISDDNTKTVFQGLFDYHQNKVNAARDAMHDVLKKGGNLQDARDAYHKAAAIPRTEMIQLVKDLNIKVGISDPNIQNHFDNSGKLPRYEDEQESVISFVDLTSSSKNVNSSTNTTKTQVAKPSDEITIENGTNAQTNITTQSIIQKLLDEIQVLKNKIKELETRDTNIQKAVFEQQNPDIIHFADWVSDYSQGLGHYSSKVKDERSIPVNVLNKPNSYNDVNNSLALGRQGQVTMGFSEPVTDKLIVYEASTEKNILELASVEVSTDGKNWVLLTQTQYQSDGSYVHEYSYDLSSIGCITHVRVTDNAPSNWGDGFDVDAIGATKICVDSN